MGKSRLVLNQTYFIVKNIAGNGTAGDNGSENWSPTAKIPYARDPLEAQLNVPSFVTVFNDPDPSVGATIYICDTGNFFIKMIEVDRDGKLTKDFLVMMPHADPIYTH